MINKLAKRTSTADLLANYISKQIFQRIKFDYANILDKNIPNFNMPIQLPDDVKKGYKNLKCDLVIDSFSGIKNNYQVSGSMNKYGNDFQIIVTIKIKHYIISPQQYKRLYFDIYETVRQQIRHYEQQISQYHDFGTIDNSYNIGVNYFSNSNSDNMQAYQKGIELYKMHIAQIDGQAVAILRSYQKQLKDNNYSQQLLKHIHDDEYNKISKEMLSSINSRMKGVLFSFQSKNVMQQNQMNVLYLELQRQKRELEGLAQAYADKIIQKIKQLMRSGLSLNQKLSNNWYAILKFSQQQSKIVDKTENGLKFFKFKFLKYPTNQPQELQIQAQNKIQAIKQFSKTQQKVNWQNTKIFQKKRELILNNPSYYKKQNGIIKEWWQQI